MAKTKEVRTYPIDVYLKDCERPEGVKRMMMDFFRGRSKTLEEWKYADDKLNNRRC